MIQGQQRTNSKKEQEAIKTLREDTSHVILTADKGVALVIMDKSQYIDKCTSDNSLIVTNVYKSCRDTTKKLHRNIQEALQQLNRDHRTTRLFMWSKCTTTSCSLQELHSLCPGSMVYPKYTRLTAPCAQ